MIDDAFLLKKFIISRLVQSERPICTLERATHVRSQTFALPIDAIGIQDAQGKRDAEPKATSTTNNNGLYTSVFTGYNQILLAEKYELRGKISALVQENKLNQCTVLFFLDIMHLKVVNIVRLDVLFDCMIHTSAAVLSVLVVYSFWLKNIWTWQ
ncbi:hypothetical protein ACJX0J_019830, partial [Zea mays]